MRPCSVCCLEDLPSVRTPPGTTELLKKTSPFTSSMVPLFDDLGTQPGYSPLAINVIKTRFCALVDAADRQVLRCNWWDMRLFILGFGGSLLVTIAAAIGQAGYMTTQSITIVNTIVLLLSSIATAALGLRERLKFREYADISKRLSSSLQRRGFLFLSGSGKFTCMTPADRIQTFITDVENCKFQSDQEHLALRSHEDTGTNASATPVFTNQNNMNKSMTPKKQINPRGSTDYFPPGVTFQMEDAAELERMAVSVDVDRKPSHSTIVNI